MMNAERLLMKIMVCYHKDPLQVRLKRYWWASGAKNNGVWSMIISFDWCVSFHCRFYPKILCISMVFDVKNSLK